MVVSPITGQTADYNVPFSMIQSVKEVRVMSVVAKGRPSTTVIDLDGSQGNAFVLLGYANRNHEKKWV